MNPLPPRRTNDNGHAKTKSHQAPAAEIDDLFDAALQGGRLYADGFNRGEVKSRIAAILSKRLGAAAGGEPHCWHCGVVLESTEVKLRCDQCPADCDDELCNAFGCAPTTAATPTSTEEGKDEG